MTNMPLPIRPLLYRAINAMEAFYQLSSSPWSLDWDGETLVFGRAALLPEELVQLGGSSEHGSLEVLARQVWRSSAKQKQPTVWFLRNYSLEASLIFLLCTVANVPLANLIKADLSESQFRRITSVIADLTDSPLFVCEIPEGALFGERLGIARWVHGAELGICDWILSPEELAAAQKSRLDILAPRKAPTRSE